jgi:hypothetical protein
MGAYIKLAGDYYLQRFSNLRSKVDKESLYAMTLDVLVADRNANKQSVSFIYDLYFTFVSLKKFYIK